jgi:hypothetical protein
VLAAAPAQVAKRILEGVSGEDVPADRIPVLTTAMHWRRLRRSRPAGESVALPLIGTDEVPWLSVEQMREVDRIMVEELGISLVRMMENAGRNLAELARHLFGGDTAGRAIVALVGSGRNGGGGRSAGAQAGVCSHLTCPPGSNSQPERSAHRMSPRRRR